MVCKFYWIGINFDDNVSGRSATDVGDDKM